MKRDWALSTVWVFASSEGVDRWVGEWVNRPQCVGIDWERFEMILR